MYSTLRDYRFGRDIDDIRGSAVFGPGDEKLGKIDDVIFDSVMRELTPHFGFRLVRFQQPRLVSTAMLTNP